MAPSAGVRALLLAPLVAAFPTYLTCNRPLTVGHVIMGKPAIESSDLVVAIEGKQCGSGTYAPGEELTVSVSGGGTYMLEVANAKLQISGNTCSGRRYANLGSATSTFVITAPTDSSTIEAWIGRGTGPTLADMPVAIFTKCTLSAAGGGGGSGTPTTPTPAPAPAPSPATSSPSTSAPSSDFVGQPLTPPTIVSSTGTVNNVELVLKRTLLVLPNNLQQYTLGFNGAMNGPCIRVKPGDKIKLKLTNQATRTSNVHVHGLHIHGRAPGDSVFISIKSGDSYDYEYDIPSNHMGGTFLYHPHYHGSAAIQAGGGSTGMLIVDDNPNQLPPEIAESPEILLLLAHLNMPLLKEIGLLEEEQCQTGYDNHTPGTAEECDEENWSNGPESGTPINVVLVNNQYQPVISMAANRWYRWRVGFMTPFGVLKPRVDGCETLLLAKDGIYVNPAPRAITRGFLGPGNRAEWMVRCPVGTHVFSSEDGRRRSLSGADSAPLIPTLATVEVTDQGYTACDLPTFSVSVPCYLVDLKTSEPEHTFAFQLGPTPFINGQIFSSPSNYIVSMPVGKVIQYDVSGLSIHPFHNHINSFQIVDEPTDTADGYFRAGDWHDTIVFGDYSASLRFQTDSFTGPQVLHCHELPHEDLGMMAVSEITGEENTIWPGAKQLDPSCTYSSVLEAPTILTEGTCSTSASTASSSGSQMNTVNATSVCYESDCRFMISYKDSTSVADSLEITVRYAGHAWLGIGVSPDGQMSAEAVAVIASFKDRLESHVYSLGGRTATAIQTNWVRVFEAESISREGGFSTLVVTFPYTDSCDNGELAICRNGRTVIIATRGSGDDFAVHPGQTRITLDGDNVHITPRSASWDMIFHVICMAVAWFFCAPVALLAARLRHYKSCNNWLVSKSSKNGMQIWFLLHRNCLVSASLLTLLGGITMFVATEFHFVQTHSYFGVATVVAVCVQILDAFLRPGHHHRFRKLWELLHRSLGVSIVILAMCSFGFGVGAFNYRVNREFSHASTIHGDLQPSCSRIPDSPPPSASPPRSTAPAVVSPAASASASPPPPAPAFSPPPLSVQDAVQEAARRIEEVCLSDPSAGPTFIRLAWNDAGTYDSTSTSYGPRASMRFDPERSNPSNKGLGHAMALLEPVKQAVPSLSYADLWQLAAVVSIEMMGGPRVPFRVGRVDASGPEESALAGLLPGAHDTAADLRRVFYRMGFNDANIVALAGAHTVGICRLSNSGFRGPWDTTSHRFDNEYFRALLNASQWQYDGKQYNSILGDGSMMLKADLSLGSDPEFSTRTRLFARDESAWFEVFAESFWKLGGLGHNPASLVQVEFNLRTARAGALQAAVKEAAVLIQALVHTHRVGPAFVRLAWSDAATFNRTDNKYGPRASTRFDPELSNPSNKGLGRAMTLLEPVKQAVPALSYADLWQLAAVVSIEMMGGPRVPFRAGRVDASGPEECAPAGLLPGAHDTAADLRRVFYRMGFNDRDIVALVGAHTLGRCHPHLSGFNGAWTSDPLSFDNQYYKDLLGLQWALNGDVFENSLHDGRMMLKADIQLSTDPLFLKWTEAFAREEELFFAAFSSAFQVLSELGHPSLWEASFTLSPILPAVPRLASASICLNSAHGSCVVHLRWVSHRDNTVTATVKVTQIVGWIALAVSKDGHMVYPMPSHAVVGNEQNVNRFTLMAQDITSVSTSALLSPDQSLIESSFEHSNGFSELRFRTNITWFTRYMDANNGSLHFIYAHSTPGDEASDLGYHGLLNRGGREILAREWCQCGATSEILANVQQATNLIANIVRRQHVGPTLVRLAWNDAGSYDSVSGKYGPRASMRFDPERSNPSNKGLGHAMALLEPVKQAVPSLSYADLWQLAAVVSIEMMGGPRVPFRVGRVDASGPEESAPAGLLPGAHDTAADLRRVFYRMGFNDRDIVALVGAHTLGRCHPHLSGFNGAWTSDPLSFDNQYFVSMLNSAFAHDGRQWNSQHGTMMLDADIRLLNDSVFSAHVRRYASHQESFFTDFSSAYEKLSELGSRYLTRVHHSIPTFSPELTLSDNRVLLKPGMELSWILHADGNVSATVTLHAIVGWIGIGISKSGRMVSPASSSAVVGAHEGVQVRELVAQDIGNVTRSAPLQGNQLLREASFSQADGVSSLTFRTSLSWFTRHTNVAGTGVWFIYAHGSSIDQSELYSYHGLNRGNMHVRDFVRDSNSNSAPPPPPLAAVRSIKPRDHIELTWVSTLTTTSFSLRVQQNVPWLALGISAEGNMIYPQPSRAVVGTVGFGVQKRTLKAQDMTYISASAPLDAVQDLVDASVSRENGATILSFTVSQSFVTQFANGGSAVHLIYSHGEPGAATSAFSFGYHGPRRGSILIPDFVQREDAPLAPPPSPPRFPSSKAVELKPQDGVVLTVGSVDSALASIELVVETRVPWLAVAVSHSGWMVDPQPSKAIVADVTSASVRLYDLNYQSPAMPERSVAVDTGGVALNFSSIDYSNGATRLYVRVPISWLTMYADAGTKIWLLWAHGSASADKFPSYHTANRGTVSILRAHLLGEQASDSSPPPVSAPSSSPATSGGGNSGSSYDDCNCDATVDYCGELAAYNVAKCYISKVDVPSQHFDHKADEFEHVIELTSEVRMAWTVYGTYPSGEIKILIQARTLGWVGFGIRNASRQGGGANGNGMIQSDIYMGNVIDGVVSVQDSWSDIVAAPVPDEVVKGHASNVYNIGGEEDRSTHTTTIYFTRKLASNDTWDHDILPGVEVPIIFAYSRKDVDSFTHYHGPTRGFDRVVLILVEGEPDMTNIFVSVGVAFSILILAWAGDYGKRRMAAAAQRIARQEQLFKQVEETMDRSGSFMFGMVLVPASSFLRNKKFVPFETLRDSNALKVFDTLKDAHDFAKDQTIIFFSHQWLGWEEPDPNNVHYNCMTTAVKQLVDLSPTASMDTTWVWVDYSCMPQRNGNTLSLAVSDLSDVAAVAGYFVVVAPSTMHVNTGLECDLSTYQARGWCRLEQFSYVCTGHTQNMLVATSGGPEPFAPYIAQPAEWKQQALWVLQGQYTCCQRSANHSVGDASCDKDKLKHALLRMYLKAICYLPPCPLREQLLERDFEILTNHFYGTRVLKLARKKFEETSIKDSGSSFTSSFIFRRGSAGWRSMSGGSRNKRKGDQQTRHADALTDSFNKEELSSFHLPTHRPKRSVLELIDNPMLESVRKSSAAATSEGGSQSLDSSSGASPPAASYVLSCVSSESALLGEGRPSLAHHATLGPLCPRGSASADSKRRILPYFVERKISRLGTSERSEDVADLASLGSTSPRSLRVRADADLESSAGPIGAPKGQRAKLTVRRVAGARLVFRQLCKDAAHLATSPQMEPSESSTDVLTRVESRKDTAAGLQLKASSGAHSDLPPRRRIFPANQCVPGTDQPRRRTLPMNHGEESNGPCSSQLKPALSLWDDDPGPETLEV